MKQKKLHNNIYSKITFFKNVHMNVYITHKKYLKRKTPNLAVILSDREMDLGEVVKEDFHFKL